ncbi:DNA polymerase III subunit beta [Candidatus Dojkabacteria bacterium]|nr:DNA polymerase III subunit beta [Candidatus Dojkabacteria bacterium]
MKFSIKTTDIAKYMANIGRLVDPKPSIPVLGNILINASKDGVMFTASNLELSMQVTLKADVSDTGVTTVPARTFSEFILSIPEDEIEVSTDGKLLHVKTKKTQAQFNTVEPEDFPEVPKPNGDAEFVISTKELAKALLYVTFAAGNDGTSPVFRGVCFDKAEKGLSLVASDGYRLSQYFVKGVDKIDSLPWIVPVKPLREIEKLIAGAEDDKDLIKFYLVGDKKQLLISYDGITIVSRLIEGEYPDYKSVIPADSHTTAEFDYETFKDALKQTNIFARDIPGNKTLLSFDSKGNKVSLEATLVEVGSNKSELTGKVSGNDLKIIFSSKSLTELFNTIKAEQILFEGEGPEAAGVFKVPEEENFLHIIMPMSMN